MTAPDRIRMSKRARWNIWRIKNRWLRAAAAWAVLPPLLIGLFLFMVALAAVDAMLWAVKEFGIQFLYTFRPSEWRSMLKSATRAMTAKEPHDPRRTSETSAAIRALGRKA